MLSPDGKWFAYTSDREGERHVYVRSFPDGREHLISGAGGYQPLWGTEGKELFYRRADAVMVVSIDTASDFLASSPELLFKDNYLGAIDPTYYAVHPNGELFLMVKQTAPTEAVQINLVQNWVEELKRLVPIR